MFEIIASTKFLKDLKLLKKRSAKDLQLLQDVVALLQEKGHQGLAKNTEPINFQVILMAMGMPR